MELLIGSGNIYEFLAEKITSNYLNDLIQISPKAFGSVNGVNDWYDFKNEVDEARFLLNDLPEIKQTVFTHVYFCIPSVSEKHKNRISWSFDFVDLLKEHILSYIYLLNNLITYKSNVHVFNEMSGEDFEVQLTYGIVRPLVITALQGTSSALHYYTSTSLKLMTLDEWWNSQWNWRKI